MCSMSAAMTAIRPPVLARSQLVIGDSRRTRRWRRLARENLAAVGRSMRTVYRDRSLDPGLQGSAPYDVIASMARRRDVRTRSARQLKEGWALVAVVGRADRPSRGLPLRGGDISGWPIM